MTKLTAGELNILRMRGDRGRYKAVWCGTGAAAGMPARSWGEERRVVIQNEVRSLAMWNAGSAVAGGGAVPGSVQKVVERIILRK